MIIVKDKLNYKKFDDVLGYISNFSKMLLKLKELVQKQKTFEEESLQYKYKGKDKEEIWFCMEFFYQNLWNAKEFRPFVYTDLNDDWENYHFQLEYKGKYSEVEIIYGIGAFCVIHPLKELNNKSKILHLDKIKMNKMTEIEYEE